MFRELRAVYTSMPNMDLKKLNKMADVLLINEEITGIYSKSDDS